MKHRLIQLSLVVLIHSLLSASSIARTTIEWWQFWTDPAIKPTIMKMVQEFESAHPDISVKVVDLTWANGHEKLAIAFASGTAPDIVELGSDWIAQFADNDQLANLSEHIASDSAELQGWEMATYQESVWAVPWILGTRVLFANRDLLIQSGLDSDWVPVTTTHLYGAAKQVNNLGDDIYGWGSNTAEKHRLYKKFLPFFWSYGGNIFSDNDKYCLLASEQAVTALRFYKTLHDSMSYVADQRGIEDAFLDGKVGLILSGDWLLKRIELENRNINLLTTLFPGLNYTGTSFMGGEFLAINRASDHVKEAMTFIRFITSPANQVRFCKANRSANPSSKTAQNDPYFQSNIHLQTFIKQMYSVKHPPVDPDWVHIEGIIEHAVEDALFDSGLPAQALYEARLKIDKLKDK